MTEPVPELAADSEEAGTEAMRGPDGRRRCPWALAAPRYPEYMAYHDQEWGHPVRTDQGLYERLVLEAFQSGLSWLTILRKRPAFREAFVAFAPAAVARFTEADVARLLADERIVRNRRKIDAAVGNARAVLRLRDHAEDLTTLLWSYADGAGTGGAGTDGAGDRAGPRTTADVPARTPASVAMARALKRRGFVFVGPTTCYALMQAAGLVNDHLADCWVRDHRPQVADTPAD